MESTKCIFIEPGIQLKGTVDINPSKSYCHRYLITGALLLLSGKAESISIKISSVCDDIRATLDCLESLGINNEFKDNVVTLTRIKLPEDYVPSLNCGESGTTLRFILPVASLFFDSFNVTGEGSLLKRPLKPFIEALEKNGVIAESTGNSCLPLKVSGRLKAGHFTIPGNISSQFISGLMMSLPFTEGESSITVISKAQSVPYIIMTMNVLNSFGIHWEGSVYSGVFYLNQCEDVKAPESVIVPEGDWSSATFWKCANFLGSDIEINGLAENSLQADSNIEGMLKMIARTHPIDVSNMPDSFPALAVCAALKPIKTEFTGISRLKFKESNRINSVVGLLKGLGGTVRYTEDEFIVYGKPVLKGGTVDSCSDHRIAMAACIAAARTTDGVKLLNYDVTSKSYPDFYEHFKMLGGKFDVCDLG